MNSIRPFALAALLALAWLPGCDARTSPRPERRPGGPGDLALHLPDAPVGACGASGQVSDLRHGARAGHDEEVRSGAVRVEPARLERIGVRFATAELAPLEREIRATGNVAWDETRLVDVTPRVSGSVVELAANALGAPVKGGRCWPRSTARSCGPRSASCAPRSAQERARAARGAPERADALVHAARARLRLFGVGEAEIARACGDAESPSKSCGAARRRAAFWSRSAPWPAVRSSAA